MKVYGKILTLDDRWTSEKVSFLNTFLSWVNLWTSEVSKIFGGSLKALVACVEDALGVQPTALDDSS